MVFLARGDVIEEIKAISGEFDCGFPLLPAVCGSFIKLDLLTFTSAIHCFPLALLPSDQVTRLRSESRIEHEFSVFWVPRRTLVSDEILTEAGTLGEVNISEYPLYFAPLADDVLSLELGNSFKDLYLVCCDNPPLYCVSPVPPQLISFLLRLVSSVFVAVCNLHSIKTRHAYTLQPKPSWAFSCALGCSPE